MNQHPVDSQNSEFVPHNFHHSTHQKVHLVTTSATFTGKRCTHKKLASGRPVKPLSDARSPLLRRYSSANHVRPTGSAHTQLSSQHPVEFPRYAHDIHSPYGASQPTRLATRTHTTTLYVCPSLAFNFTFSDEKTSKAAYAYIQWPPQYARLVIPRPKISAYVPKIVISKTYSNIARW